MIWVYVGLFIAFLAIVCGFLAAAATALIMHIFDE